MTEREILDRLTTRRFGRRLFCKETIDSTNNYGRSLLTGEFEEGTVVLAENQTSGRGRNGRSWHAEGGKNLTFSILVKPKIQSHEIGVLPIYAGLSVATAIEELSPLSPVCKWPNDILIGGKKLCGILSEAVFHGEILRGVVIGIGLNVNQEHFPDSLRPTATSLAIELGHAFDRISVLTKLLQKLEDRYETIEQGKTQSILEEWTSRSDMFGREIIIDQHGQKLLGIAQSIDSDGSLIVRIGGVNRKIFTGEIAIQENT